MAPLNLPQLTSPQPACDLCTLSSYEGLKNPGIPTIHDPESLEPSPTTPAIVCVGQNPGFHEDIAAAPFVGLSGKILRNGYLPTLRPHASIYLTNAVRCHTAANDTPPARSSKACTPYFHSDLLAIASLHPPPLYLLLLGGYACSHTLKHLGHPSYTLKKSLSAQGLSITHPSDPSVSLVVFSTYHPAYLARDLKHAHAVAPHLSLIVDAITGATPLPTAPTIVPPRGPRPSQPPPTPRPSIVEGLAPPASLVGGPQPTTLAPLSTKGTTP